MVGAIHLESAVKDLFHFPCQKAPLSLRSMYCSMIACRVKEIWHTERQIHSHFRAVGKLTSSTKKRKDVCPDHSWREARFVVKQANTRISH